MLYGYKYINNKPRTYCRCVGINGEEYVIRADALRTGATKTIKNVCHKQEAENLIGEKFGLLTPLYPTDKRSSNGSVVWTCRCDCGNLINVSCGNLKRGHTRSCGCNHISKWESYIYSYLKKYGIKFVHQKRFKDCVNEQGSDTLPFDFYLEDYDTIIEYDGEHHFRPINGWGGVEKFRKTQKNEEIKNKYCEKNQIKLFRIPYTYSEEEVKELLDNIVSSVTITVA